MVGVVMGREECTLIAVAFSLRALLLLLLHRTNTADQAVGPETS
jgi:hypothetical protein